MTFSNGEKYDGHFEDSKFNGHGVFTWSRAMTYTGAWKDGKMHGAGKLT